MSFINILRYVIQISIVASILAGIIIVIRPVIKKIFGAKVLYFLWILLLIKLIMPYGPESKASIYNLFSSIEISDTKEDEVISSNSKISSYTNEISYSKDDSINQNRININSNIEESQNEKIKISLKSIFELTWIIGILFHVALAMVSYCKLVMIRRNSLYRYDKQSLNILKESLDILNITRSIDVSIVENIKSPALCSVVKPEILIPKHIFYSVNSQELKYILLHELCHYKRKDVAVTWVIYILKTIYWFNPIIIFALNTMREDIEIACDNMVISKLNNRECINYGYTIINVLKCARDSSVAIGITPMINNKRMVRERINMIGKNKKSSAGKAIVGAVLIAGIGAVTLSSGVKTIEVNAGSKIEEGKDVYLDVYIDENGNVVHDYNVVIYNSHGNEEYSDGYTVEEASIELKNKLKELNVDAGYLAVDEPETYVESFLNSGNIIKENIDNYENRALIDFHISDDDDFQVVIDLCKGSENYVQNLELAQKVKKELESLGVSVKIYEYEKGNNNFNLNLSEKSLMINIGNKDMDKSQVNELLYKISEALSDIL